MAFGEGMCLGGGTFVNGGLFEDTLKVLDKWEKFIDGYSQNNLKDHFNLMKNLK